MLKGVCSRSSVFASCRRVPAPDPEDLAPSCARHLLSRRLGCVGPRVAVLRRRESCAHACCHCRVTLGHLLIRVEVVRRPHGRVDCHPLGRCHACRGHCLALDHRYDLQ